MNIALLCGSIVKESIWKLLSSYKHILHIKSDFIKLNQRHPWIEQIKLDPTCVPFEHVEVCI